MGQGVGKGRWQEEASFEDFPRLGGGAGQGVCA